MSRDGARKRASVQLLDPTTAINLLSAQASLRNSQNSFLNVWLNYYAARMRLFRELGVMSLDQDGRWIEFPTSNADADSVLDGAVIDSDDSDSRMDRFDVNSFEPSNLPPLPPAVPDGLIEAAEYLQRNLGHNVAKVELASRREALDDKTVGKSKKPFECEILDAVASDVDHRSLKRLAHGSGIQYNPRTKRYDPHARLLRVILNLCLSIGPPS